MKITRVRAEWCRVPFFQSCLFSINSVLVFFLLNKKTPNIFGARCKCQCSSICIIQDISQLEVQFPLKSRELV